ncbi:MAG: DNA primase [Thaumarchaeota archaeon]|nr:DNA primase [Nitrososphaerota archaeon]MDE1832506.1 DNA primase [Nitrososphaerota archaeon]MDE1841584.1 DNA primase [Nitrososphaerota archaeon]MDE1878462.1 DNA primase [Nitrososphaerota archaeon]
MLKIGVKDLAKYPFLTEAGEYLRNTGLSLEQLGHPDWQPIVEKAYGRIVVASSGQIYGSDLETLDNDSELLSFLVAIILLKSAGIATLIRRFSLAESRRAEKYLQQDLWVSRDKKNLELPLKIIRDLFAVNISIDNEDFVIKVPDYLHRAIHFHEKEWKLVNRRVANGLVYLSAHETVRLIRAELGEYINGKIQSVNVDSVPPIFRQRVEDLVALAKKFSDTAYVSSEYPPCVKHGIEVLEKGENLPHSGRFLLATYLLSKGQTVDQIAPLFKNAPDYNERTTRYQLDHISGSSGSGTKYQCPSCEKLRSESLCFAIPDCDGIINPVQFGKKRKSQ